MKTKMRKVKRLALSLVLIMLGSLYAHAAGIPLQVGIFDPTSSQGTGERSPMRPPTISIDDYTLNTGAVWFDATLQILDEGENVVYTTFVPAGTPTVVLPSTLSGDYELQLIQGYWYFYGYIIL